LIHHQFIIITMKTMLLCYTQGKTTDEQTARWIQRDIIRSFQHYPRPVSIEE
jgi:hypothetical protein